MNILKKSTASLLTSAIMVVVCFLLCSWSGGCSYGSQAHNRAATNALDNSDSLTKQKGGHVFGRIDSANVQNVIDLDLEWVTLVPWGFQDDEYSPKVSHGSSDSTAYQNYNASWIRRIAHLRSHGIKIFLKPHVWLDRPSEGKWRSDIEPAEADWASWSRTYREFILRYAQLAADADVQMYCVGAELTKISCGHPEYWRTLIKDVRSIYKGEVTYAANWYEEYEKIKFWEELDYIGVQAYFPLVDHDNPTVDQLNKGWLPYLDDMKVVHQKFNKPILFTELGYKSTSDSAIKPWEWAESKYSIDTIQSLTTQANCYTAFFESVWPQEWFAGAHIWQYRSDFDASDRYFDLDFTPQGKPADAIIRMKYQRK